MMEFRIEAINADELVRLFQQAPEIVGAELRTAIKEASMLLERELKDAAPTGATATLRGSINAEEPQVLANQVIGVVGTSIAHALPVELGTRPHFPRIEPLRDWVRAKLAVDASQVNSVAFLIARKISRVGTPAQPFFADTVERNQGQVQTIFIRSAERMVDRLSHV